MKTILYNPLSQGHLARSAGDISFMPVMATLKRTIHIPKKNPNTSIKKGEKVLVRPVRTPKNGYEITTYTKETGFSPLQPEFWLAGISPKKTVYIKTDHPEKIFAFKSQRLMRYHGDLFPKDDSPSIEEIGQLLLPSCFLLSPLQSIINMPNGKAFIRGMMRENNDKTITIRLFNPNKKRFEYITIDKAIVINRLGPLNPHSAMWVFALEQAYAIMMKRCGESLSAALNVAYSGGGFAENAIKVLTGLDSSYTYSPNPYYDLSKHLSTLNQIAPLNLERALRTMDKDELNALCDFFNLRNPEDGFNDLLTLCQYYQKNKIGYDEAIAKRSTKNIKDPNVASILNRFFQPFPSTYSSLENRVFYDIKKRLNDGKIITANTGSPSDIGNTLGLMRKGLVVQHVYSVLDVFEKKMTIRNEDGSTREANIKFVKVKNPWGYFGKVYRHHKKDYHIESSFELKKDVFVVELREFCNDFLGYHSSEPTKNLMHYDTLKEDCIYSIYQTIQKHQLNESYQLTDLITIHQAIESCEDKILALAQAELTLLPSDTRDILDDIFNNNSDDEKIKINVTNVVTSFKDEFYWIEENTHNNSQAIATRIYNLYRYKKATKENPLPEIRANIIDNTQVPGKEILTQHSNHIKTRIQQWLKKNDNLLEDFDTLIQAIVKNISPFIPPRQFNDTEQAEQIIKQKKELESIYRQLEENNTLAQTFNLPGFSKKLQELKTYLKGLENITDDIEQLKIKKHELMDSIDSSLEAVDAAEKKALLSTESANNLKTALTNLSPESQQLITLTEGQRMILEAQRIGKQLQKEPEENIKNLGNSVVETADKAQKRLNIILHISQYVEQFYKKFNTLLKKLSFFFHEQNEYIIDLADSNKPII